MSRDEAVPNRREAALHADAGVHAALKTLQRRLWDLRSPDGSRMNPAKTCQDIRRGHPHKDSGNSPSLLSSAPSCQCVTPSLNPPPPGEYWIDPDGGSASNAIRVFCNMDAGETCISASPANVPKKSWWTKASPGSSKPVWFGTDMNAGSRVRSPVPE